MPGSESQPHRTTPKDLRMRVEPFEHYVERYEAWFEVHRQEYEAELAAVRACLPDRGRGLEVGVGTGRFAAPLGVGFGVEPARAMARKAHRRGIRTVLGTAEALPFGDGTFDYLLMVTTICFLNDPVKALHEARRVLRRPGRLILGFVDRESSLGRRYEQGKDASPFYSVAVFYTPAEVTSLLQQTGFRVREWKQTLLSSKEAGSVVPGVGEGGFVVCSAEPA